ncbi:hypothetical protein CGCF413_v000815 [Colletotrichum fructicola]|nr:hypothetical protein CGCF413_v000815 [Colletotrichum fructicola]
MLANIRNSTKMAILFRTMAFLAVKSVEIEKKSNGSHSLLVSGREQWEHRSVENPNTIVAVLSCLGS